MAVVAYGFRQTGAGGSVTSAFWVSVRGVRGAKDQNVLKFFNVPHTVTMLVLNCFLIAKYCLHICCLKFVFQPRTFNFQGGQIFPWHIGTKYVNPALGAGYIIRYVHPMKWANNYHNGYTHKVSNMQPRNITLIQGNIIYKY